MKASWNGRQAGARCAAGSPCGPALRRRAARATARFMEAEGLARERFGREDLDAGADPSLRRLHVPDQIVRGLAAAGDVSEMARWAVIQSP